MESFNTNKARIYVQFQIIVRKKGKLCEVRHKENMKTI